MEVDIKATRFLVQTLHHCQTINLISTIQVNSTELLPSPIMWRQIQIKLAVKSISMATSQMETAPSVNNPKIQMCNLFRRVFRVHHTHSPSSIRTGAAAFQT